MIRGDGDVVSGWKNKLQAAVANVTPASVLAEQHRKLAEPRSGNRAASIRCHVYISSQGENMPTKKGRPQSSSSRSSDAKRGAARSGRTRTARKKGGSRKASGTTKTLKTTAVKVMAGAAAGAVRAVIPPLEKAAGTSERAAGLERGSARKATSAGRR